MWRCNFCTQITTVRSYNRRTSRSAACVRAFSPLPAMARRRWPAWLHRGTGSGVDPRRKTRLNGPFFSEQEPRARDVSMVKMEIHWPDGKQMLQSFSGYCRLLAEEDASSFRRIKNLPVWYLRQSWRRTSVGDLHLIWTTQREKLQSEEGCRICELIPKIHSVGLNQVSRSWASGIMQHCRPLTKHVSRITTLSYYSPWKRHTDERGQLKETKREGSGAVLADF